MRIIENIKNIFMKLCQYIVLLVVANVILLLLIVLSPFWSIMLICKKNKINISKFKEMF